MKKRAHKTPNRHAKISHNPPIELPFTQKLREALAQRNTMVINDQGLRPSAVILPMFVKENRFNLLFTKRTEKVAHHKGEISFPGGSVEPSDKDLRSTAIRECVEEIGLLEKDINIIGILGIPIHL
jgi:8-oxo-dGTP pyrophosphatase MutT (NUDIX family)